MTTTDTTTEATTEHHLPGGLNRIEVWKPPTDGIHGYFDVTVLDPHGVKPDNIIKDSTPWKVRFDVWLEGDIWKCVCGTLCFEVFFERANDGHRTSLSKLVGKSIDIEFNGCEHFNGGRVHVSTVVDIAAGALPPGDPKPGLYDWRAVLSYLDPCGDPGVLSGYDTGYVQIWDH